MAGSAETLASGLLEFGVAASDEQVSRLAAYGELLVKWNAASNLVSRRDIGRLVPRHLLDSLSVLPWVRGDRLLDLGSGGGLPGIPVAILRSDAEMTLIDRSEKKCRFLNTVVRELSLDNVKVVALDAMLYRPQELAQTILSRAVAPPAKLWSLGLHLLARDGRMVLNAHVGGEGAPEVTGLPTGVSVSRETVRIPGLTEPHELLVLEEARY